MAKRYRAKRRATEDASGLAGWLFTDLLLGLVMIFLSAVAFTAFKPEGSGDSGTVMKCEEYVAAFVKEPLSIKFRELVDASTIGEQIRTYVEAEQEVDGKKQILKDAKVAVGIIYGYYSGENRFEGSNRAKAFYSEFIKSDPANFPAFEDGAVENMRFIGSTAQYADINEPVQAELFFVYNTCNNWVQVSATTLP